MDKYEYQVCADQIKTLIKDRRFTEAMDIADTIDWRRVKSFSMLCTVSEIYKITKHYSEARDILLLAYERYPDRPNVVYALCELAVKLDDISEAIDYYKEYVRLKPHDTNKYVLLYKIYDAQDVPLEEKISLLEEYKKAEYTEKWAYELAKLYHQDGQETKCVETCDELVLWFGEGKYVRKALELKMQHAPLTREQQSKYDGTYVKKEPVNEDAQNAQGQIDPNQQMNKFSTRAPYSDVLVKPVSTDKYSTINLQEELAKNMAELYARERQDIQAPYYGTTSQLYEPSQEQFLNQINQAGQLLYQPTAPVDNIDAQINTQPDFADSNVQHTTGPIEQQTTGPVIQQTTGPVYEQPEQVMQQAQPSYDSIELPIQHTAPLNEQEVVPHTGPAYTVEEQVQPVQPEIAQEEAAEQVQPVQEFVQPVQQVQEIAQPIAEEPVVQRSKQITMDNLPVYEEANREISMQNAEEQIIDEQIPGQIDISDFMREWEAKKESAKEQRRAEVMKKSLENTSDYMAQLKDIIPGIDQAVKPEMSREAFMGTSPMSQAVAAASAGVAATGAAAAFATSPSTASSATFATAPSTATGPINNEPVEEVLRDDEKGLVTRTTMPSPIFEKEDPVKYTESGAIINGPVKSSVTGEIPDILPSAKDILPSGYRTTLEDEYSGEIAKIRKEDEEKVKRLTGELPPLEEKEEEVEEEFDYGEAEEIEDVEQPEIEDETPESVDIEENLVVPTTGSIPPLVTDEDDSDEVEEAPEIEEEDQENEDDTEVNEEDNSVKYPYHIDDFGEVEDMEDINQPDEVEDMIKTRPLPIDEIEAQQMYEAGIEEEITPEPEAEEKAEAKPSRPSYMVMDDNVKSHRDFDDSEMEIFGRFEEIEAVKAQICEVIDDMSMDPYHGNVVVMGSELFDRKTIAIDLVRAIQRMDTSFSGKVAKISGAALNKKNIPSTLAKLENGALIVENAGELEPLTISSITDYLAASDELILVVLEDEKEVLEPLLLGCANAKSVFDARITIDDFNDDNLVSYAKGYAREQGYSIDEMGILALHTRIAEMQSLDHKVSIDEVVEIVERAIKHVDRKNVSHFMDMILAKRFDDDDYVVLREKDFLIQ